MARPNKPSYFPDRNCWRIMVDGKRLYFCKGVRPDARPQREGLPRVCWEEMERIFREAGERSVAGSDPTLLWLANRYTDWVQREVQAGRMGRKQLLNLEIHLAYFADVLGKGSTPARMLAPADMDEFFERFRSTPLRGREGRPSAHYVHNVGKTVRAMFRWASRPVVGRDPLRLLAANPLDGYGFPKQPGAVRGYVEGVVIRRFLRWAWAVARREPAGSLKRRFDRIYVLMLRFQRLTGCRPGEACRLEWAELAEGPDPARRWEGGVITIRPERVKTRKQSDKARRIWITPATARLLRSIDRLPGHHPAFVFPHMRGNNAGLRGEVDALAGEPWPDGSAASSKLTALRKLALQERVLALVAIPPRPGFLAGLESVGPKKLVAYANRHAYASEGSTLGFSDEQIAEQMGNSPEVMRRVYAHSVDSSSSATAREIAERRRGLGRREG